MIRRRAISAGIAATATMLAAGCGGGATHTPAVPATRKSTPAVPDARPARPVAASPGTAATRTSRPPFAAVVSRPLRRADLPFSWRPGCPVPPDRLRAIRLSFVGFDGRAHAGEIIVNSHMVRDVIKVFSILYRARFPIMKMEPVDAFHGSDSRSMAADNTSGFYCRLAVAAGPPHWSMHAYGLAIDVNTVQNPYLEGGHRAQPPAGAAYTDRTDIRLGMAYPGGVLVSAFRSVGWGWGGGWPVSPDYQHFSVNGR